jgi:hypothetical protein
MIEIEELKKLLPANEKLTDEQILELRGQMEQLADIAFDMWLEDKRKEDKKDAKIK